MDNTGQGQLETIEFHPRYVIQTPQRDQEEAQVPSRPLPATVIKSLEYGPDSREKKGREKESIREGGMDGWM